MNGRDVPEGDRIYDLYTGAYKAHIVRIALELDVFSPLDASPGSAETVARACRCDSMGLGRLLDYLTSLRVLEKQGAKYSLSVDAATFLVRGKKSYVGDLMTHFASQAPWELIGKAIRDGQSRTMDRETDFVQMLGSRATGPHASPAAWRCGAKPGLFPTQLPGCVCWISPVAVR